MTLSREQILAALSEIAEQLATSGVRGYVHVVGGAAIVLRYGTRELTQDVDAAFYPAHAVRAVATVVARRRGFDAEWLNDGAKAFLPLGTEQPEWLSIVRAGGFEVAIADPRCTLAMKIRASRARRDESDIETLLGACGVTSVAEALEIYEAYYPEDPLKPQAVPLLDGVLARRQQPGLSLEVDDLLFGGWRGGNLSARTASNERPTVDQGPGGKRRCPERTLDGDRCKVELLPGSTCPSHHWTAPR
ncbi:MAG: hypothetical protein ACYCTE_08935 [Acidimicrobiales bacterium]